MTVKNKLKEEIDPYEFIHIDIEDELDNLAREKIIGGGRDGIVFKLKNGTVCKIYINAIPSRHLREHLKYLLSISGKLSKLTKISLDRDPAKLADPLNIATHHLIVSNYIKQNPDWDNIVVVEIQGIAYYCGKPIGIIMQNLEGIPSAINSHADLLQLAEAVERNTGIVLDKFGRNVMITSNTRVLIDIL